jgi:PAS domain S-box-containing protein
MTRTTDPQVFPLQVPPEAYARLFHLAADPMLILDPTAEEILEANRAACDLYGYEREDLLGRSMEEFTADVGRGKGMVRRTLEDGSVSFETVQHDRHGRRLHLMATGTRIDLCGRPAILAVNRDVTARREAEARLRLLEIAVRDAMESVVITDTRLDEPGPHILYVNRAFEAMSGYTAAEVLGKNPRILQGPNTSRELMDYLRHRLETGQDFFGETTNYRKDGTPFEVEWSISPVHDTHGRTTHFVAVQRDITRRKRDEAAMQWQLAALGAAHDGIALLDGQHRYVYMNPAHARIFGYDDPEELLGRTWSDILPPAEVERFERDCLPQYLADGAWHGTSIGLRKDGSTFPTSVSITALPDGGMVCVCQDDTERRKAEASLRDSEVLHRTVVENVTDAVFLIDRDGRFEFLNDSWTEITGWSVEEAVGQDFLDFVLPESRSDIRELFSSMIRGSRQSAQVELGHEAADGNIRWLDARARTRLAPDGRILGVVGTLHDATARREARESLERALDRERELHDLKDRFVSMASHELRTPLSVMRSSVDFLDRYARTAPAEKRNKHAQRIRDNVRRMEELLEDVLALGREDDPDATRRAAEVDLRWELTTMACNVQLTKAPGRRLDLDLGSGPLPVTLDVGLLRLVVQNLLSNAFKYSPTERAVYLSLSVDEGRCTLVFRDEGIGMSAADAERMGQPFHRGANVGAVRGTGLGVAIAQRALQRLGGEWKVESTEGRGTTVTVFLPLEPNDEAGESPQEERE